MGRRTAAVIILAAACLRYSARAQQPAGFAGTWVVKAQNLFVVELTLARKGDSFTGSLRMPAKFSTDPDGDVVSAGGEPNTDTVTSAVLLDGELQLTIGDATFTMALQGQG